MTTVTASAILASSLLVVLTDAVDEYASPDPGILRQLFAEAEDAAALDLLPQQFIAHCLACAECDLDAVESWVRLVREALNAKDFSKMLEVGRT